ncbi:MAG: ECF-type sigma factor [Holophagales bacterium]|nr:ECF-type sigma factor [Holophagales bacterium]
MVKQNDDITRLFELASDDPEQVHVLLPRIYDELKRLAAHFLRGERRHGSLATTELVHEAYLRLFQGEEVSFANRRHFFTCAAVAMRRLLVEQARRRGAGKRIPRDQIEPLEDPIEGQAPPDLEILALDQALHGLAELSPRQAQLVELRYFAGLTETEAGEVLGLSRVTVARDVQRAKRWLRRAMVDQADPATP